MFTQHYWDTLYYDSGGSEAEVEAASEDFSLHAARLGEAASLACSMSGSEEGDIADILLG